MTDHNPHEAGKAQHLLDRDRVIMSSYSSVGSSSGVVGEVDG